MSVKERKITPRAWMITVIVLGIVLAMLCGLAIMLHVVTSQTPEPTVPQVVPQIHAPPAVEILPPPEANPYGPADFQYKDRYLTCSAGKSTLGIDISEFQEVLDWDMVRDAGVEFVFIRIGLRGYGTAGNIVEDEAAQSHYEGAKKAGLKVGVYFFSQALTTLEAVEEARFTLDYIKDWELDMPVVFDWEYVHDEARTAGMGALDLTHITLAFCKTIEDAGYTPMIYFNQNQSYYLLQMERLTDYPFWLAMYSDEMTYPYKLDMWQYTSTGAVPGIEGNVDLDLWLTYDE